MTRRARSSTLPLVVLSIAVLAGWIAACAGGNKHGIGPCCAAQGSVQEPSSGPAFTATAAVSAKLYAQPFVLETNNCIALATLDLTTLLDMPKAGGATLIDPGTLTYTVKITAAGEGHQVAIVIFDDAGKVRGVGVIGSDITPSSTPIQVAPIELLPPGGAAGTTGIGETTVEAAAVCELAKRGLTGSLVAADVRAVLTSTLTASYSASSTNAKLVLNRLLDYEAAIGAITKSGSTTQQAAFRNYRTAVEAEVDACLAGVTVPGCDPTPDGIDFYRFTRYSSPDASAGIDPWGASLTNEWPLHAQCFVQRWNDRLGTIVSTGAPDTSYPGVFRASLTRQAFLFRVALAEAVITRKLQAAPLGGTTIDFNWSTSGILSLNANMAKLRTDILGVSDFANSDFVLSIFNSFGNNIGNNLDRQVFDPNGQVNATNSEVSKAFNYAGSIQLVLGSSSTYAETYSALIDDGGTPSNGARAKIAADIANTAPLNALPAADQARLTDVIFFASVNAAITPNGSPAPDTLP